MHYTRIVLVVTTACCLSGTAPSHAAVYRVRAAATGAVDGATWDTAFRTIQAAIDVTSPGDEVWVSGGPYYENVTMKAGIGLYGGFNGTETERQRSAATFPGTELNGGRKGAVVTIPSGADGVTVDGFTITNGASSLGAGITCESDGAHISNNYVVNNNGSGIYHVGQNGVISDNTIDGNIAEFGGGIVCGGASIRHNIIRCNTASVYYAGRGGGIFTFGKVDTEDNQIIRNYATISPTEYSWGGYPLGGGIYCHSASGIIARNTIYGNGSLGYTVTWYNGMRGGAAGAGICAYQSDSTPLAIIDNVIVNNMSFAYDVYQNSAMEAEGNAITFRNNTVVGNAGSGQIAGPGFTLRTTEKNATSAIENNVFASNAAGFGISPNVPVLNNCFHMTGDASVYVGANGNIEADPLLACPDGVDLHPMAGSPCIGAGRDTGLTEAELDRDSHPRLQGAHVDIGAYEAAVAVPYGMAAVARSLRILAGITTPTPDDFARMDAVKTGQATPTISLSDAVWLIRHLVNEDRAIASLRILFAAQEHFRVTMNPPTYAVTLKALIPEIGPELGSGLKDSYQFMAMGTADTNTFAFAAVPIDWPNLEGIRCFYIDQRSQVRYEESGPDGRQLRATWKSPWLP